MFKMLRPPVEGQSNCGGNGGSGRFRILKSHWKCTLTFIAIIFFDVGYGLESNTAMPTASAPIIDPRTRNRINAVSYHQDNITVCTSEECKRAALKLKGPMNLDVEPCDDFYEYACGNWQLENQNWFTIKAENISTIIREFLEKPIEVNEPKPVQNAKNLYKSCIDTDNKKQGLQAIIDFLESVGLPPFPTYGSSDHNETFNFDWLETAAKIKTKIGVDVLIGISTAYNYISSVYLIWFAGRPNNKYMELTSMTESDNNGRPIISSSKSVSEQRTSIDFDQEQKQKYRNVLESFAKETQNDFELPSYMDIQIENFIRIDRDIKKMISDFRTMESDYNNTNTSEAEYINQKYLQGLSRATGEHIETYSYIDATDRSYLVHLAKYISKIQDPRELELYMWMKVVLTVIEAMDVLDKSEETRSKFCSKLVQKQFDGPIRNGIEDPNFQNVTKSKINTMIQEAKRSLLDLIAQAEWMDFDTFLAFYKKIYKMKSVIGYINSEESYDEIHIDPSKHVLYNLINVIQEASKAHVKNLKEPATCDLFKSHEVNAQFVPESNCIDLPWAILQYPLYDLGLESLNYGSTGSLIGHEMSHAFDHNCIHYDEIGFKRQWWTNNYSTFDSYKNISSCFVDQYSTYSLDVYQNTIDRQTLQVNGAQTLGDNVADNNGVRIAFAALQRHLDGQTPEPTLPGFQDFSSEKLFFLSYANLFCGKSTDKALKEIVKSDVHSPIRFRVNGALRNNKHFAEAWNCKPNSYMNPNNKCILF